MPDSTGSGFGPVPIPDTLLDTAPCGFLTFAEDGRVELVNTTLLELLGVTRGDVVGQHIERILNIGSRIFYQTHWFPLLRMHGRAEEIFLMLRTNSGADVGMLVNAVRREQAGRAVYDCVLMRVRERQKYEEELLRARRAAEQASAELEAQHRVLEDQATELELAGEELRATNEQLMEQAEELEQARAAAEEANEAKSTFLAVMSHELRTPLNAISGYVELLDLGVYGVVTPEQKDALDRIRRSQAHLLGLINDILNLARIESGRVEYELEDVALVEVLREVRPLVDPQIADKELRFETQMQPDLVVRADREKVMQIVINLLSNAIKFTAPGGRIGMRSFTSPDAADTAFLEVSDSGIGIPADKLGAVFEPFVRVTASGADRKEGTGLGLAISRDLARGMGGDVTATSEPGVGSTFRLQLPKIAAG